MPAEVINLNDTNPAAPTGKSNVKWQKGSQTGTDSSSGYPVFPVSAYIDEVVIPLVIFFGIATGVTGTNVGPMLATPRDGEVSSVVVVTKTSDATVPFQFDIRQNGTSIFTGTLPTVSAATTSGTVSTFTTLTSVPLAVTKNDVFTINIIQGSSSWICTVQAET